MRPTLLIVPTWCPACSRSRDKPFTNDSRSWHGQRLPTTVGETNWPALGELISHAYLAAGRLLQSDLDHRLFLLLPHPVLAPGLASTDLEQRQLATLLIKLQELSRE